MEFFEIDFCHVSLFTSSTDPSGMGKAEAERNRLTTTTIRTNTNITCTNIKNHSHYFIIVHTERLQPTEKMVCSYIDVSILIKCNLWPISHTDKQVNTTLFTILQS